MRYKLELNDGILTVKFNDNIEVESKDGDTVDIVDCDDGTFFEFEGYAPFKMFDDADMEEMKQLYKYIDDIHRDSKYMSCCKGYVKIK